MNMGRLQHYKFGNGAELAKTNCSERWKKLILLRSVNKHANAIRLSDIISLSCFYQSKASKILKQVL